MKKYLLFAVSVFLLAFYTKAQEWDQVEKSLPDKYLNASGQRLGESMSVDGDYAVVGLPAYNGEKGMVLVLHNNGSEWEKIAQLTPSDGENGDKFGSALSISGDIIVVGCKPQDNNSPVYIYEKPAGEWQDTVESYTLACSQENSAFGSSVAVSGDTIVVGARIYKNDEDTNIGSVIVYVKESSNWVKKGVLTASDGASGDCLGASVAISNGVIVSGAECENLRHGAAYVYVKPAEGWVDTVETAKLTASDGKEWDLLGHSVDISGDYIVVSSSYLLSYPYEGYVYVYEKPVGGWQDTVESHQLAVKGINDIDIEGNIIVAGSKTYNSRQGAAYIFERDKVTETWEQKAIIKGEELKYGQEFGYSVAYNGSSLLAGAHWDKTKGASAGAVYISQKPSAGWVDGYEDQIIYPDNYNSASISQYGYGIDIYEDYAVVSSPYYNGTGRASVLHYEGGSWNKMAYLYAQDVLNSNYGVSVAIYKDIIAIGDNMQKNEKGMGAVYIYDNNKNEWKDSISEAIKLILPIDSVLSRFGTSVDIYKNTLVVGASIINKVFVYENNDSTWDYVAELSPATASSNDRFGYSVSIYDSTIVVGSPYNDDQAGDAGAVYVFKEPATGWENTVETAMLVTSGSYKMGQSVDIFKDVVAVSGRYGTYVFVKPDDGWGNTTSCSAELQSNSTRMYEGRVSIYNDTIAVAELYSKACLFSKPAGGWSGIISSADTSFTVEPSNTVSYGWSISLYGNFLGVGAYRDNEYGLYAGAAYFYQRNMPLVESKGIVDIDVCENSVVNFEVSFDYAVDYRWQVSTDDGTTFTDLTDNTTYSGVSESILTVNSNTGMYGNKYRCIVSNSLFADTSAIALLSGDITPPELEVKNIELMLDDKGQAILLPSDIVVSATDNCKIQDTTLNKTVFKKEDLGDNKIEVTLTDVSGNSITQVAIVTVKEVVSSVQESSKPGTVSLYPNPVEDIFTIQSKNILKYVEVIDITGQVILMLQPEQSTCEINIEYLQQGMFFVKTITSDNSTQIIRIIKK